MKAWAKFVTGVPPQNGRVGIRINGQYNDEWLSEMTKNEWTYITHDREVASNWDNYAIFIYNWVDQYIELRLSDIKLEIFSEKLTETCPNHTRASDDCLECIDDLSSCSTTQYIDVNGFCQDCPSYEKRDLNDNNKCIR